MDDLSMDFDSIPAAPPSPHQLAHKAARRAWPGAIVLLPEAYGVEGRDEVRVCAVACVWEHGVAREIAEAEAVVAPSLTLTDLEVARDAACLALAAKLTR